MSSPRLQIWPEVKYCWQLAWQQAAHVNSPPTASVQFERGVSNFGSRMLSPGAEQRWGHEPRTVKHYFESRVNAADADADDTSRSAGRGNGANGAQRGGAGDATTAILDDSWTSPQYLKWGPFSHAWDVRIRLIHLTMRRHMRCAAWWPVRLPSLALQWLVVRA